jgi:TM2 domain-containing membrane protein YozV
MKIKLTLSILALIFSANLSYASFPVNRNVETTISTEVISDDATSFTPAAAASGKSQLTATLLCFFLGGLGIHRFYLGYTWQGIVQILTLGGLGIWVLIDFIRILIGDLGPKNGEYAKTL